MEANTLPELKQLQLYALFSLRKVWEAAFTKSVFFKTEYANVIIDQKQLRQYVELIGFQDTAPGAFYTFLDNGHRRPQC